MCKERTVFTCNQTPAISLAAGREQCMEFEIKRCEKIILKPDGFFGYCEFCKHE
jgi:hypothetical protein